MRAPSMMKINIKPLSVNECWQGRRFKTKKYKAYESELLLKLKPLTVPDGELSLNITVGLSNALADIDNILKPFIDILQKKYGFNDRDIMSLNIEKVKAEKGCEFIKFNLAPYVLTKEVK
jgi:Holliday junction resolvase RusA-like endonuclease